MTRESLSFGGDADLARAIDRACDRFAAALQSGAEPRIEDFLAEAPADVRDLLLQELLPLELEAHLQRGRTLQQNAYLTRFPQAREIVDKVFDQATTLEATPGSTAGLPMAPSDPRPGAAPDPEQSWPPVDDHAPALHRASGPVPQRPSARSKDSTSRGDSRSDTGPSGSPRSEQPSEMPSRIGRYAIQQELGKGGFAVVYLAHDTELDRLVAVKVPRLDRFTSEDDRERFVQEARSAAQLDHPGVVRIHDAQRDAGLFYIVQQYIPGQSLAACLKTQRLPARRVAELMIAVGEAVGHAHRRGFVHRDLKPANILLDESGQPHVADFGLALHASVQQRHRGEQAGTCVYMSPEQVRGEAHRLDGRSDIWSLGVMLYEMLAGCLPFSGDDRHLLMDEIEHRDPRPLRQIDPAVPRELARICATCLAKRAADRYESASDLIDDLRHWLVADPAQPSSDTQLAAALHGESTLGPNPYRGLSAFREVDVGVFFGREKQTARAYEKFRHLHDPRSGPESRFRLLTLLGPSGCGKSSLARAGLVAELQRQPLPGWESLVLVVLAPGAHPIESLALALARVATEDSTPVVKAKEFEQLLQAGHQCDQPDGLLRIVDAMPGDAAVPLLLLIDQFEEIYSLCKDTGERDAFVDSLLHATSAWPGRISAVITLRSDFLGETQDQRQLNQLVCEQGLIVPALNRTELRRAIAGPAESAGYQFEEAFIDLLVNDTADRVGALPMLQFTLTRVWEGIKTGKEPAEILREIDGVGGALAGEAQSIYEGLDEHDRRLTRRIFLSLVQLGEGTRDTRRRATLQSIVGHEDSPQQVRKVIERFSSPQARLVTLSAERQGAEIVEVTHEALFDHWFTLRAWLDSSRDMIRFHRRVEDAAQHWQEAGRPDGLLWRSPDLDNLREFHKRAQEELTTLAREFYVTADRQHRETERLRNRRLRLYRLTVAIFAILIAVITLLGFQAYRYGQESERALAAEATALADARRAQQHEETMRQTAEANLEMARQTNQILASILASADPAKSLGRELTVRQVLDVAVAEIDLRKDLPPTVESQVRMTIGNSFQALGEMPSSRAQLERAVEMARLSEPADQAGVAHALTQLGGCQFAMGAYAEAMSSMKEAKEILTRLDVLNIDQVLALRTLGDCESAQGNVGFAHQLLEQAVARARSLAGTEARLELAETLNSLGALAIYETDFKQAQSHLEECLKIRRELLPDNHPLLATTMSNLAVSLINDGQASQAVELLENALKIREIVLPPNHPDLAFSQHNLGMVKLSLGELDPATKLLNEALRIRRAVLPATHRDIIASLEGVGVAHLLQGNKETAAEFLREACTAAKIALAADPIDLAAHLARLGGLLRQSGDEETAEMTLQESVKLELRNAPHSESTAIPRATTNDRQE